MPTEAELQPLISLYNQGRIDEALAGCEQLHARYPDDATLHNMLGVLHARVGRADKALSLYDKALVLRPEYPEALNNRGNVLNRMSRSAEAIDSFNRAIALYPGYAAAHSNLAHALHEAGRLAESLEAYRAALRLQPQYAEALAGQGKVLNRLGRHREAVDSLRNALRSRPDVADWHNEMGNALCDAGRVADAVACYRDALAVDPELAEVHGNLGNALRDLGRFDEARSSFEAALRLDNGLAEAHYNLSHLKTFANDDPQVRDLEALASDPGKDDNTRCYASFALGKAYEDVGDIDRSFEQLSQGNRLRKRLLQYDIEQDRAQMQQIRAMFRSLAETAEPATGAAPSKTPIFIVGMPRSGTTLVEQILASHSRVHGAGELQTASRILSNALNRHSVGTGPAFGDAGLRSLREAYLDELDFLAPDSEFVTDKDPTNFRWLGYLLNALPEARVIHVRRNPVATCWSMYKRIMAPLGYSNDLIDLAEYYAMYRELMDDWSAAFPGRIHELVYERLTEDQSAETRDLLEFCGLPWEDACLEFHRTRRAVATMSAGQVRRSMYTGSSDAWRAYAAHLAPLLTAMKRI